MLTNEESHSGDGILMAGTGNAEDGDDARKVYLPGGVQECERRRGKQQHVSSRCLRSGLCVVPAGAGTVQYVLSARRRQLALTSRRMRNNFLAVQCSQSFATLMTLGTGERIPETC